MTPDALDAMLDYWLESRGEPGHIIKSALEELGPLDPASLMRDPALAAELDRSIEGTLSGDLLLVADPSAPTFPVSEPRKSAALDRLADRFPFPSPVHSERRRVIRVIDEAQSLAYEEHHKHPIVYERVMAALYTLAPELWRASERKAADELSSRLNRAITEDLGGGPEWRRRAEGREVDDLDAAHPNAAGARGVEAAVELWLLALRTRGAVRLLLDVYRAEPALWDDIPETVQRTGLSANYVYQLRSKIRKAASAL